MSFPFPPPTPSLLPLPPSLLIILLPQVANLATDAASLTFQLPFDSVAESGVLTYITGSETDENTPEQPDLITPQTTSVETGSTFNYTAPGSSFGVLVVGV